MILKINHSLNNSQFDTAQNENPFQDINSLFYNILCHEILKEYKMNLSIVHVKRVVLAFLIRLSLTLFKQFGDVSKYSVCVYGGL